MCEDEHRGPGDNTCVAAKCTQDLAEALASCGGTWPSTTCSITCAAQVLALQTGPCIGASTTYVPQATKDSLSNAEPVCQFVKAFGFQPAMVCTAQTPRVALTQEQVCDGTLDCDDNDADSENGNDSDETCVSEREAALASSTCPLDGDILDCEGVCRPSSLLENTQCEEVFNCAEHGYDNQYCVSKTEAKAKASLGGDVDAATFMASMASASGGLLDPADVQVTSMNQTVEACMNLPVNRNSIKGDSPAGLAGQKQLESAIAGVTGASTVTFSDSSSACAGAGRRLQEGVSVAYTATASQPLASTMGASDYSSTLVGAINSGGSALSSIDPSSVNTNVGAIETEIDYAIVVDTTAVTAGANTSTAAQAAALQSALSAVLADTTALAAAINANGGSVTNIATSVSSISSDANTIVVVVVEPVAVAEAQPDDTVVAGLPVTKDEAIVGLLVIIIAGACGCCCVIGFIIWVMSAKNKGTKVESAKAMEAATAAAQAATAAAESQAAVAAQQQAANDEIFKAIALGQGGDKDGDGVIDDVELQAFKQKAVSGAP